MRRSMFNPSSQQGPADPLLVRLPEDAFPNPIPTAGPLGGGSEAGSTTVEYAIGAIATAAFAGLLLAVLKSGSVKGMLTNIIQTALSL